MNEVEYFEKYKDKIKKTAEYLCQKDVGSNVEEKFEELKLQYYNKTGTRHNESFTIYDRLFNIHEWLETIRYEPIEHFKVVAVTSETSYLIYHISGGQHSAYNINLGDIHTKLLNMITSGIAVIGIYIFHNHPFIYKAAPSPADLDALKEIIKELEIIEAKGRLLDYGCQVTLIDFSIVTVFDYWSVRQLIDSEPN